MSVHITEAKFLLLEVSSTTLSPSFWHFDVSARDWGKVSTARGLYYYIESQYLKHEVRIHHWGQVSTARGLLLHWDPESDTWSQYTSLRPSFYCERSTTTLRPRIWHMKSVHITEAKFLLRKVYNYIQTQYLYHDVSTYDCGKVSTAGGLYYCIESQYLTHEVSTHPWDQDYTAKGQYNYIVSKYLTHEVSTHHWDQDYTARGQYYYIESEYLTPSCQYTWLRQSFYCWRSVLLHWVPVSDNWS